MRRLTHALTHVRTRMCTHTHTHTHTHTQTGDTKDCNDEAARVIGKLDADESDELSSEASTAPDDDQLAEFAALAESQEREHSAGAQAPPQGGGKLSPGMAELERCVRARAWRGRGQVKRS